MAYLDRLADADLAECRVPPGASHRASDDVRLGPPLPALDRSVPQGRPGRRRLRPGDDRPKEDLSIPGREFTFGDFIASQAGGDAAVLADHGRPVLQLHLTDHDAGLAQLREVLLAGGRA